MSTKKNPSNPSEATPSVEKEPKKADKPIKSLRLKTGVKAGRAQQVGR